MKKVIIGGLCAAVVIVAIGVSGIWFWFFRELPVLGATLSLPLEAETGSTVTMTITATNSHNKPVTLDSIDIDASFLAGFQVVSVAPEPSGTTRLGFLDQRSWDFGKVIPPGNALSVTFTLRALSEGHYTGDVDVCNPNQDYKTLLADVVVTEGHSNRVAGSD